MGVGLTVILPVLLLHLRVLLLRVFLYFLLHQRSVTVYIILSYSINLFILKFVYYILYELRFILIYFNLINLTLV